MTTLWFALAILGYGCYNFFTKAASNALHPMVGILVLQVSATIAGFAFFIIEKSKSPSLSPISNKGLLFSALAGLAVGLAEILTFYIFSKGIPASVAAPILIGGGILASVGLSVLFLQENLRLSDWVGVILILVGTVILARK